MGLTRLGRLVVRIVDPFGTPDRAADRLPRMALNREVDISVRIGFPSLALEHPARLPAAARVAATWHDIGECAVRILRILLEVADALETLLVAQLDAAQVQHRVLHRDGHLLPLARLVAADQRRQDADRDVHARVAVAERSRADGRRTVPEARRRGRATRAL